MQMLYLYQFPENPGQETNRHRQTDTKTDRHARQK